MNEEGLSLLFRVGKMRVFKDIVLGTGVDPKPRDGAIHQRYFH
jgi:hypothetical protein